MSGCGIAQQKLLDHLREPMARHLRAMMSVLRISADMQHIDGNTTHIAECVCCIEHGD